MFQTLSLMNDTKWRRLLDAISVHCLPQSHWTFCEEPTKEYCRSTPHPEEILNGNSIGDTSVLGPFFFRDVLSVRWPRRIDEVFGPHGVLTTQSINELATTIRSAGQFEFELTDDSLILYAYRKIE